MSLTLFIVPAVTLAGDWTPLFDGESLDGWTILGGDATYEIDGEAILGKTGQGKNTFLTKGPYGDFALQFDVKCDPPLNSGVQVRSHIFAEDTPQMSNPKKIREKGEVYGYQCEIREDAAAPNGCSGNFWDESRRTKWLDESVDGPAAQEAYKPGEWNTYRILAQGDRIRSWVNGTPVADFVDDLDASGFIGLQVHSIRKNTGPYEVRWQNLMIKELAADESVAWPE